MLLKRTKCIERQHKKTPAYSQSIFGTTNSSCFGVRHSRTNTQAGFPAERSSSAAAFPSYAQ